MAGQRFVRVGDVELCARLAEAGRHVVRYDHRDTGRSTTGSPGSPGYSGSQLARDCVGLIEALDRGPVHLVGISMGAAIGQAVALTRPDLLTSLTLMSTTAVGGIAGDPLPGPSPEVSASFATPPPDPDWTDVGSYADWVVAAESTFAGRLPVDETHLRAVAATVHARSTDVAAAGNHWLVVPGMGHQVPPPETWDLVVPALLRHTDGTRE